MKQEDLDKAAQCGEPSYVWRAGQQRRLRMILEASGKRLEGPLLENGCGVGTYVERLAAHTSFIVGLEYDFIAFKRAHQVLLSHPNATTICAAGEELPFPAETFSMILSHEVLEHVQDDRLAVREMVRVLQARRQDPDICPKSRLPFRNSRYLLAWSLSFRQHPPGELPSAPNSQPPGASCSHIPAQRSRKIVRWFTGNLRQTYDHLRRL